MRLDALTQKLPMNLEQFIALPDPFVSVGAWIEVEGFSSLYVRKGSRYIDGTRYGNVFDLANMNAEKPGKGAFTRLVARLEQIWDGPIWIENVLEEKFGQALVRKGFESCNVASNWGDGIPRCFVKHLDRGKVDERNR